MMSTFAEISRHQLVGLCRHQLVGLSACGKDDLRARLWKEPRHACWRMRIASRKYTLAIKRRTLRILTVVRPAGHPHPCPRLAPSSAVGPRPLSWLAKLNVHLQAREHDPARQFHIQCGALVDELPSSYPDPKHLWCSAVTMRPSSLLNSPGLQGTCLQDDIQKQ